MTERHNLDAYDTFLALMQPYMQMTGATVTQALEAMPADERERAIVIGHAAGIWR